MYGAYCCPVDVFFLWVLVDFDVFSRARREGSIRCVFFLLFSPGPSVYFDWCSTGTAAAVFLSISGSLFRESTAEASQR